MTKPRVYQLICRLSDTLRFNKAYKSLTHGFSKFLSVMQNYKIVFKKWLILFIFIFVQNGRKCLTVWTAKFLRWVSFSNEIISFSFSHVDDMVQVRTSKRASRGWTEVFLICTCCSLFNFCTCKNTQLV